MVLNQKDGKFIEQAVYFNNELIKTIKGKRGQVFFINKIIKSYHGAYILAGAKKDSLRMISLNLNKKNLVAKDLGDKKLKLEVVNIALNDGNDDGVFAPNETGAIKLTLKNNGVEDISGKLKILNSSELNNLVFPTNIIYIDYLEAGGESDVFSVPIWGAENLMKAEELIKMEMEVEGYQPFPIEARVVTDFMDKEIWNSPVRISWLYPYNSNNPSKRRQAEDKSVKIGFIIHSVDPLDKFDVKVLNNGVPLVDDKAIGKMKWTPMGVESQRLRYEFEFKISQLNPDDNEIKVQIGDHFSDAVVFNYDPNDLPNIHLLAIGPEYRDLKQTKNDVTDFVNLIKNNYSKKVIRDVFVEILVDSINTEKKHIETAFNNLLNQFQMEKIRKKDFLIVFYSGHGGETVSYTHLTLPTTPYV